MAFVRRIRMPASHLLGAAGFFLALGAASPARAQVLPIGPDFQVNTYTTFDQAFPQVTVAPDGDFSSCSGAAASKPERERSWAGASTAWANPWGTSSP